MTLRDVAGLAGVSAATVSLVLRGRTSFAKDTVERVREAVARLDYVPNAAARALATRSGRMLAMVASDFANPIFGSVLRGIEEVARRNGYVVVVGDSAEDEAREADYLEGLARHDVDGVILSPVLEHPQPRPAIERWRSRLVLINRRIENLDADLITSDNWQGGYDVGHHLLGRGHRRVGVVVGPLQLSTHRDRIEGMRAAFAEVGETLDDGLVQVAGVDAASAYRAAKELFRFRWDNRPTALFAASGVHATGAYQTILELGLRIPEDLSFIAFDTFDWTTLVTPAITTVEQPSVEIGRRAAEMLLERLAAGPVQAAPRRVRLRPLLRERGSVAAITASILERA